jgi:hypothetical protein
MPTAKGDGAIPRCPLPAALPGSFDPQSKVCDWHVCDMPTSSKTSAPRGNRKTIAQTEFV